MSDLQGLMSLKHADILVGQTISWPIYNQDGAILFEAGVLIEDQRQLEHLLEVGYCEADYLWDSIPGKIVAPVQAEPVAEVKAKPAEEINKESVIELDSVRWTVGEVFYLQTHDQQATRYTVRLIGYVKNKSLLVTAPTIDGRAVSLREGQTFIIRAFPGKKAYAFTAALIKNVYSPHTYLHLSYPSQVRSTTIRQGARAVVKIIASVTIGAPEQTATAVLGDLSMGGTSGLIKKELGHKGDTGFIKFKVNAAGSDEYLSIKVMLRSLAATENGKEFRHGFEFVDVSPQSKLILSAFVHQTLAEMD
ncbi:MULTISPECIES: flagellar brake protein [unclassified Undibacterium]|uniref:flagellar brake protein n=1 Tax=unclassified Undibacterium TaxID=2630295 RepID=UPI002AC8D873|nr:MULTISPECIES: flagellar brake protein [unclassified Undibacterium]MEB0138769.1 flagellar brake protein [Undibacterium sp. CCC2.1]MEB0170755.1 flagellar brake protein [Undibacterium sp. CCC1.1]MEB0174644.1 flagellar brake protein [Undibacterium sp. CCC3.4]MEB0213841.1 flagellar brake protein [Undibacterium sp. 5I2]WPX42567.1 flagellar brake protein [Undibacterium sp. CCC3.4]